MKEGRLQEQREVMAKKSGRKKLRKNKLKEVGRNAEIRN